MKVIGATKTGEEKLHFSKSDPEQHQKSLCVGCMKTKKDFRKVSTLNEDYWLHQFEYSEKLRGHICRTCQKRVRDKQFDQDPVPFET